MVFKVVIYNMKIMNIVQQEEENILKNLSFILYDFFSLFTFFYMQDEYCRM